MKYQYTINILLLLLARKRITAREIADKYEISVRSVYRYVEELIVAGIPIDVYRGRYGGLSIADTFKLPTGYFTREEYAATVNALGAMIAQMGDQNLVSALEKLERQRRSERREYVCGNVIVDGGSWGDINKFGDKMKVCERAVNESLSLCIDYISREGEHSKRVIDPHVLILKQNVWYVYAFCHTKQQFRTFKIGRIKQASFTGRAFTKKQLSREDIPLDFYYDKTALVGVTLKIDKESLPDVEEWLGIDNIEARGDGLYAEVKLPDDEILVGKILSYGGGVKVISPPSLQKRVKDTASRIANDA